jgi:DNA invertase Pin-like site-specific DNA recombinase
MENRHAVLLVRVSTEIQDYDAQILDLEEFAKKKGFNHFKVIQTKESGLISLDQRTGTNEMFNFIKENPEYNTVFATEISRLARRQSFLHLIRDWLEQNKVQLFLKDSDFKLLDTNNEVTPEGAMMFSLFGIFAEAELTQKKKRFAREKKKLMALGLSISGKLLFGYKREMTEAKRNRLVHDENNAEIVRIIFNWYLNGFDGEKEVSINKINIKCIKENFPKYTHSKRNINKLLKEEAYTGSKITNNKWKNPMAEYNDKVDKYLHSQNLINYGEPIIDRETFDNVQQKLTEKNTTVEKSSKHTTLLSKMFICPTCGKYFQGDYRIKEGFVKHTYRCSSRSTPLKCSNKQSLSMTMLDGAVWSLIKSDLELLAKQIVENDPKDENTKLEAELTNLEVIEKEIREKVKRENNRYSIFVENPDSVEPDYFEIFQSKIKMFNKKLAQINDEKAKIKSLQSVKQEQLSNIDFVIKSNLSSIEKSKSLLKKYINIFVDDIRLLHHNTRFTVISINFRKYGNDILKKLTDGRAEFVEAHYSKCTYVILDKKQTLKIRAVKTNLPVTVLEQNIIKVMRFEFPIEQIFETLNENSENIGIIKEFKEIEFKKLEVYI